MKVVESGYKIDLHIHSASSNGKDKGKVAFNTLKNIRILAEKLNENGVQICAITDHDVFDYKMYKALKKYEEDNNTIIKVFPGVEFSVEYLGENETTVLHVIAIFNDEDDTKIEKISNVLKNSKGNIDYDRNTAFSEEKFLSILRKINLDTILIVHQKSSLSSERPYRNDVKTVGNDKFEEFVYTDYFEAFEFKNRKNEVFNKNYIKSHNMTDNIRFITGSDCHDWRSYPKETQEDNTDFIYTYVKCLPCFRGLVMAITDNRRIKTVNSFFNTSEAYVREIEISIDGTDYLIPLSRGINVIIGDNSIGKSMLLHKLTEYRKYQEGNLAKSIIKGYDQYLKKNHIEIKTTIPSTEVFVFDMQGEIREKFEQSKIKPNDFLKKYYPEPVNANAYKEKIQRKLNVIFDYLEEKYAIELLEKQLGRFKIINEEMNEAESLSFVGTVSKNNKRVNGYGEICDGLEDIVEKIETVSEKRWLSSDDKEQLKNIINQINEIYNRYDKRKKKEERENIKIALYQLVINKYKQEYNSLVSDSHKRLSLYNEKLDSASENIAEIIKRKKNIRIPNFEIEREKIRIQTERVHDYEFNSKLGINEIDEEYIEGLFTSELKKGTSISIFDMTQEELMDRLYRYTGTLEEVLDELRNRILEKVKSDLENKFTITQSGKDRTQELSAGFNSQIYFDILSYENRHEGLYIIDQPEDNISQKAIRDYLLDRFKTMGENRQILMVTHRPQFIVNLDVDNVIFIGKKDEKIFIRSGALEYKDDEYSILDIISENIEGGLDTLKRRWKRYEKSGSV
ncbi:MAG: hypothetical protein J6X80_07235 [Lachnospiraceae bacterium]|nr:hypothetical protein [Lachnospiraceae bacterium]